MNMKNRKSLYWGIALLALVTGLTGCATAYVEPGGNPALVRVELAAVTNDEEISRAGSAVGLRGYLVVSGNWLNLRGPIWSWGLYLVKEDGSLWDLKPVASGPTKFADGYELKDQVTYMVPPGARKLRLLVQSYMEYWTSAVRAGTSYEVINVSSYSEDFELDLRGGQEEVIKRQFGEPGETKALGRTY